jgi:hypothetical protein
MGTILLSFVLLCGRQLRRPPSDGVVRLLRLLHFARTCDILAWHVALSVYVLMSRKSTESLIAFLLGWLLGRRRRSSGLSILLLLMGALSCLMALPTIVLGPPWGWMRAREIASLARPSPSELDTLAPGVRVLVVSQISPHTPPGPYGLALFYVEARQQDTATQDGKQNASTSPSSAWQIEIPPPQRTEFLLTNGKPLVVQFSAKTNFLNAHQFEESLEGLGDEKKERRYVGYLPGQTLAVEGTWEGNGLLTARSCYAGMPDEYAASLARQPWLMLLMGVICGGLGISLLGVGFGLRLLGA